MTGEAELRALDLEIHRKVMGLECFERDGMWCQSSPVSRDFNGEPFVSQIPDYSTDIAAAWQVVERVCGPDYCTCSVSRGPGGASCQYMTPHAGIYVSHADGETAAVAICRASLLAVGKVPFLPA